MHLRLGPWLSLLSSPFFSFPCCQSGGGVGWRGDGDGGDQSGVVVIVVCFVAKRDLDWTQKKTQSSGSRGQVTCNVYLDL